MSADLSRGWLLGWQAGSLTPLPSNHLDDQLATSTNNYFLSSIWMSGYGVAADPSGNLHFVTGNSDYSGTSYNTMTNLSESVVKILPDLTTVVSSSLPPTRGLVCQLSIKRIAISDPAAFSYCLIRRSPARLSPSLRAGLDRCTFLIPAISAVIARTGKTRF